MTLQWPPAAAADEEALAAASRVADNGLAVPVLGGIAEITAMIATQLEDGATAAEVMPVIRATRRWLEQNVRQG